MELIKEVNNKSLVKQTILCHGKCKNCGKHFDGEATKVSNTDVIFRFEHTCDCGQNVSETFPIYDCNNYLRRVVKYTTPKKENEPWAVYFEGMENKAVYISKTKYEVLLLKEEINRYGVPVELLEKFEEAIWENTVEDLEDGGWFNDDDCNC